MNALQQLALLEGGMCGIDKLTAIIYYSDPIPDILDYIIKCGNTKDSIDSNIIIESICHKNCPMQTLFDVVHSKLYDDPSLEDNKYIMYYIYKKLNNFPVYREFISENYSSPIVQYIQMFRKFSLPDY